MCGKEEDVNDMVWRNNFDTDMFGNPNHRKIIKCWYCIDCYTNNEERIKEHIQIEEDDFLASIKRLAEDGIINLKHPIVKRRIKNEILRMRGYGNILTAKEVLEDLVDELKQAQEEEE